MGEGYIATDFEPVARETYTLTIDCDGQRYISSEALATVPALEANIEQIDDTGFSGADVEPQCYCPTCNNTTLE